MAKNYSAFDIIGPVMIGPSSSHTAGAARLGMIASNIAGENIRKVTFYLHGSFGKTYRGHGTDRALLAGVLRMRPEDEGLRDSFEIAESRGLKYEFIEKDLGDVHPNTVKFLFEMEDGRVVTVMGSSIGGGNIKIIEIDGDEVEFTGAFPTIITKHIDRPGIITSVTAAMSGMGVNIAFMRVFRRIRGETASMVVETDNPVPDKALEQISKIDGVQKVVMINPV